VSVRPTQPIEKRRQERRLIRRSVDDLAPGEVAELRGAFRRMIDAEGGPYYEVVGIYGLPLPMYGQLGNDLFLAWNRAHLRMFEEALAAQGIRFGIPWWDFTSAPSHTSGIPAAFAEERIDGDPNPLYSAPVPPAVRQDGQPVMTTRAPNSDLDELTAAQVQAILQLQSFSSFQQQLESVHNLVHAWVGGVMGVIPWSAYDPLFWSLQANIDRLWRVWQINHPAARLSDSLLKKALPPFGLNVGDVLDVRKLGYDYALSDDLPGLVVGPAGARNDRPSAWGGLGFDKYADAFVKLIGSPATEPPITIGIYGTWGMGKSSLLDQIRARFEPTSPKPDHRNTLLRRFVRIVGTRLRRFVRMDTRLRRFVRMMGRRSPEPAEEPSDDDRRIVVHVVKFNAWDYNASEAIWPALVRKTMDCLEDHAPLPWRKKAWHRLVRNGGREWRRRKAQIFATAVVAVPLALIAVAHLGFDPAQVVAVLGALGLAGLINLVAKATANPLSLWLTGIFERSDYGRATDLMVEIREDLKTLDSRLGNDRMLVMIDDLDRCEPAKAVEVLQALNLLLEGKSFVVCLGIDARILSEAIEAHYKGLLGEAGASGYEYLDKIIHIPFSIPELTTDYIQDLLREEIPTFVMPIAAPAPQPAGESATDTPAAEQTYDTSGTVPSLTDDAAETEQWETDVPFNEEELQAFLDIAKHLRRNPRHVKRLINVYRLVRTIAQLFAEPLILQQRRAVIEWLALSAQWPYAAHLMTHRFATLNQDGRDALESPGTQTIKDLLELARPGLDSDDARTLDDSHELLEAFVATTSPLTATEFAAIARYTINFNPAAADKRIMEIAGGNSPANTPAQARIPRRVALVELVGRLPGVSVNEAAKLLDTPREKVVRTIRDLKREGIIESDNGGLSLADKAPRKTPTAPT
jgi:Cdc6-like AAA superfamily ATPase